MNLISENELVGISPFDCLRKDRLAKVLDNLRSMEKRFCALPEVARNGGTIVFRQKLRYLGLQLMPIVAKSQVMDSEFLGWIIGHFHDAFLVSEGKVRTRSGRIRSSKNEVLEFRKQAAKSVRLLKALCQSGHAILENRKQLERKGLSSLVLEILAPLNRAETAALLEVTSCSESRILKFLSFCDDRKSGPKRNFEFESLVGAGCSRLKKSLEGTRYTIEPLKISLNGRLDLSIFEKCRGNLERSRLKRNEYWVSPLKLLANGYYLSGLNNFQYKERHLRIALAGYRKEL